MVRVVTNRWWQMKRRCHFSRVGRQSVLFWPPTYITVHFPKGLAELYMSSSKTELSSCAIQILALRYHPTEEAHVSGKTNAKFKLPPNPKLIVQKCTLWRNWSDRWKSCQSQTRCNSELVVLFFCIVNCSPSNCHQDSTTCRRETLCLDTSCRLLIHMRITAKFLVWPGAEPKWHNKERQTKENSYGAEKTVKVQKEKHVFQIFLFICDIFLVLTIGHIQCLESKVRPEE